MTPPDIDIYHASLVEMHRGGWFDLTAIDKISRLAQVRIPDETYKRFRLLHCTDFAAMSIETRSWLASEITRLFLDPVESAGWLTA